MVCVSALKAPAPKVGKIIDLQSQHEIFTPSERMRKIANSCETLGIDAFDVYGDYENGEYDYLSF